MKRISVLFSFLLLSISIMAQEASDIYDLPAEGTSQLQVRVLSEYEVISKNQEFKVALHFEVAPGWYTYSWEDSSKHLPTNVEWELPEGVELVGKQWPKPDIHYGREGEEEVYNSDFMVIYTFKSSKKLPSDLELKASLSWQVCDANICMMGSADLSTSIKTGKKKQSSFYKDFNIK